jgi:predicted DCC family thiol-disulfide oxidoreductase YuxK
MAAWAVTDDGTKVGGARAIALALATGRSARWPTWVWKVPGAPWFLDQVYGMVAGNRHRLPGTSPWCIEHPDDCLPDPASTT